MSGRWTGALIAALLLAAAPGAEAMIGPGRTLDRAMAVTLGPAAPAAKSSIPEATLHDVAITPPPAELEGELAPVVPAPEPFEQVLADPPAGQVMALIVGIDDYPGTGSDLGAAVMDADAVDEALAGFGVPVENRVLLRDGQARRAQLVEALEGLAAAAGPDDTLVFAYAGHVRKLDADTEAIVAADGEVLTDEELGTILARSRAPRGWLLLASCYAAGFTEALAPGRILTAAAAADEVAYESPSIDGSYLVHHMIREGWLQGNAGPSVQDAFAYADARIAAQYPNRRPVQLGDLSVPFTLRAGTSGGGVHRVGPEPTEPPTPAPAGSSAPTPTTSTPATSSPPPLGGPERSCSLVVLCG